MAGPFEDKPTYTLAQLERILEEGGHDALDELLLPPDTALGSYPRVTLPPGGEEDFLAGRVQAAPASCQGHNAFRVYTSADKFLGLGEFASENQIKPQRVFNL